MTTLLDPRVLAALATLIATIVNVQFHNISIATAMPYISGALTFLVGLYSKTPWDTVKKSLPPQDPPAPPKAVG